MRRAVVLPLVVDVTALLLSCTGPVNTENANKDNDRLRAQEDKATKRETIEKWKVELTAV
jgi:outer membrane biogenesis lipoprotein LolB